MKSAAFLPVLMLLLPFCAKSQAYWQQKVDTRIEVSLNDLKHVLSAYEEISYTNNSPDTLRYIYIHLWPNAYKNDHTPFARQEDRNGKTGFYYSKPKDRGYVDSLQFTIDGTSAEYYCTEDEPDIARVDLPQPLYPGKKIKIATPFKVKIPIVFSRLGHTKQAYFISQWFPKPAVYDRKGWHAIPYLDQGEFFSEYGSYDVAITLPKNYVVMATGNCTDDAENKWLDERAKDSIPSDTLYKSGWFPASSSELKTIHYHEDNVHDFAWFADKRWIVRKDTVYSPGNHNLVTTWAAYLPVQKKQWARANEYIKETITHYGNWVGPYPYKTAKAVLGDMHAGGGMEYPTVTVIDKSAASQLQTVIVHEVGHNWFYGLLGSMERDHAWMDEGLNTFYEHKTTHATKDTASKIRSKSLSISINGLNEELIISEFAVTNSDQAIDIASDSFKSLNYGVDVYYKTNEMLRWLESYMDSTQFAAGIHEYFNTWEYRHPYPEDFMNVMRKHSFKNIDWFYDAGLKSAKPIDFKITKAHINGANTEITIRNNTDLAIPARIDVKQGDSVYATAWTQPFTGEVILYLPNTQWQTLKIDSIVPQANLQHSAYRRNALFHDFGLKLKPIAGLNNKDYNKVFLSPAFGYNQYDGFMAGIVLHNITIPETRFKLILAPLYGFNSGHMAGTGTLGYFWYPSNMFREVLLQGDIKSFDNNYSNMPVNSFLSYSKLAPSLNFTFREPDFRSSVTRTLTLKGYFITEQTATPNADTTRWVRGTSQKTYGMIYYRHLNKRTYNPFGYSAEGQLGADFAKLNLEATVRVDYNTKNKALYLRGYFGKFVGIGNNPADQKRYYLNATYSGMNDYLYDGTYLARNSANTNGGQQISIQEGGFKVPVFGLAATSDNWMTTLNMVTDLPGMKKNRFRLFLDAGLIPNNRPTFTHSGGTTTLYDGGIQITIIENIVNAYIPLIMSDDFYNYLSNTYQHKNVFSHSLSFTMMFQNFSWLRSPLRNLKLG